MTKQKFHKKEVIKKIVEERPLKGQKKAPQLKSKKYNHLQYWLEEDDDLDDDYNPYKDEEE